MHSWIELDRQSIEHNYRVFADLLGSDKFAPVIKSNAYGHGARQIYEAIAKYAPSRLCVNYLSEAQDLRDWGYEHKILVVGPILDSELKWATSIDADIFIPSAGLLDRYLELPADDRPLAHIKVDTGMSRQGFLPHEIPGVAARLMGAPDKVVGICTHFANVEDVMDNDYAELQYSRFQDACLVFEKMGFRKLLRHAASSASSLIFDQSRLDFCRVGISLYGVWPSQSTKLSYGRITQSAIELRPVLTWKTKVSLVKPVSKGDFIGYGCTYRAPSQMMVAVLPVGYFEGYPRLAGNDQSYVLIRGCRCRIVGRICMNMMMVDITHAQEVKMGDEVVLIGRDGEDAVTANELALWSQSIHYEILTRLNQSIPRQLK